MMDDVFCKIIRGELPSEVVYRDEEFLVIKDIKPVAPVHVLILPTTHIATLRDSADAALLGRMLMVAEKVVSMLGLERGYRLIMNEGEHGGKLVPHLHFHLVGGKKLGPKIVAE
jgi:histidine triad (HIT) family protein